MCFAQLLRKVRLFQYATLTPNGLCKIGNELLQYNSNVVFKISLYAQLKTSELRSAHVFVTFNERAITKYLDAFIISIQNFTFIASIVCQACSFMVSSHHFTLQNMPQQTFFITLLSFPLLNYTRSPCSSYGWQGIKHSRTELCPHQAHGNMQACSDGNSVDRWPVTLTDTIHNETRLRNITTRHLITNYGHL